MQQPSSFVGDRKEGEEENLKKEVGSGAIHGYLVEPPCYAKCSHATFDREGDLCWHCFRYVCLKSISERFRFYALSCLELSIGRPIGKHDKPYRPCKSECFSMPACVDCRTDLLRIRVDVKLLLLYQVLKDKEEKLSRADAWHMMQCLRSWHSGLALRPQWCTDCGMNLVPQDNPAIRTISVLLRPSCGSRRERREAQDRIEAAVSVISNIDERERILELIPEVQRDIRNLRYGVLEDTYDEDSVYDEEESEYDEDELEEESDSSEEEEGDEESPEKKMHEMEKANVQSEDKAHENVLESEYEEYELEEESDSSEEEEGDEESPEKKRMYEMEKANAQSESEAHEFSRECTVCTNSNPAVRCAYVPCGHMICLLCATKDANKKKGNSICPLCRAESAFIELKETRK